MNRTMRCFIKKCVNFYGFTIAYAGLIVGFVPSVLCDPDWNSHLTYEQIYNSTNYAQIRHGTRPYDIQHSPVAYSFNNNYFYTEKNRYNNDFEEVADGNDLEYEEYDYKEKDNTGELLVGFAHDPFRYSIPEADYLKGVRTMDPKVYMDKGENRGKRGVVHLYNMMYCATGCEPLAYKGYGCYCGFLGAGKPTDGIDRCCKMHDQCYENIFCPFFTVYFQPYYWKCYRGEPLCALENHQSRHQFINGCAARLCECDRQFAMCVKRYPCPRKRALCFSSPVRLLQNLLMFR